MNLLSPGTPIISSSVPQCPGSTTHGLETIYIWQFPVLIPSKCNGDKSNKYWISKD